MDPDRPGAPEPGAAAPTPTAPAAPPAHGSSALAPPTRRPWRPVVLGGAGALVLVLLGVAGVRALGGSDAPTASAPGASPAPAPSAGPAAPAPSGPTLVGLSVPRQAGEPAVQVVAGLREQFGRLPVARVFASGLPPETWDKDPTLAALGTGSAVVYSFKGDVAEAATGAFDARLTAFLRSRPAGLKVWVAFHHEPEDEIAKGAFTAEQLRAAEDHLAPVVRAAGGIPTLVLMQYTLQPESGRDWHDYYSAAGVDAIGWDAYNNGRRRATPVYNPPANLVAPVLAVAKETGKPFGWGEFGSTCISTDPGCEGRAAWVRDTTQAFRAAGAEFVCYWNQSSDVDFTLRDPGSIAALKAQIAS